jgi:hypothetical protein
MFTDHVPAVRLLLINAGALMAAAIPARGCHAAISYSYVSPLKTCFRRIRCSARLISGGPVPPYIQDSLGLGKALSTLGKAVFNGIRAYAEQNNIQIEGLPTDPNAQIPRAGTAHHPQLPGDPIPLLHPAAPEPGAPGTA